MLLWPHRIFSLMKASFGYFYIRCLSLISDNNKKLSWCWQTRATRLEVRQGHQTGTIQCVKYGILLACYSKFVSKMRRFSDIRLRDLEIRVRGHSW